MQSLLDLQDAICEMVADVRQVHVEGAAQMLGGREWSAQRVLDLSLKKSASGCICA